MSENSLYKCPKDVPKIVQKMPVKYLKLTMRMSKISYKNTQKVPLKVSEIHHKKVSLKMSKFSQRNNLISYAGKTIKGPISD